MKRLAQAPDLQNHEYRSTKRHFHFPDRSCDRDTRLHVAGEQNGLQQNEESALWELFRHFCGLWRAFGDCLELADAGLVVWAWTHADGRHYPRPCGDGNRGGGECWGQGTDSLPSLGGLFRLGLHRLGADVIHDVFKIG